MISFAPTFTPEAQDFARRVQQHLPSTMVAAVQGMGGNCTALVIEYRPVFKISRHVLVVDDQDGAPERGRAIYAALYTEEGAEPQVIIGTETTHAPGRSPFDVATRAADALRQR